MTAETECDRCGKVIPLYCKCRKPRPKSVTTGGEPECSRCHRAKSCCSC